MTAVANDLFTAAQFNTYVRDNMLELAPAKATGAAQYFIKHGGAILRNVAGGSNTETSEGTTSATYTNLATVGPVNTRAINFGFIMYLGTRRVNNSATDGSFMSVEIVRQSYMVTVFSPTDNFSVGHYGSVAERSISAPMTVTGLTSGTYIFTAKYRTTTATTTTATFASRWVHVIPF